MLILTRRVGEALMVGDDTKVTVLGIRGNQVRIGVAAPEDVGVHREEIWNKIQVEKSASPTPTKPAAPARPAGPDTMTLKGRGKQGVGRS